MKAPEHWNLLVTRDLLRQQRRKRADHINRNSFTSFRTGHMLTDRQLRSDLDLDRFYLVHIAH